MPVLKKVRKDLGVVMRACIYAIVVYKGNTEKERKTGRKRGMAQV